MNFSVIIPEYDGAAPPDVREWWAFDLSDLAAIANEISREVKAGEYGISRDSDRWGLLSIEAPGKWSIKSLDGTIQIGPGYLIV